MEKVRNYRSSFEFERLYFPILKPTSHVWCTESEDHEDYEVTKATQQVNKSLGAPSSLLPLPRGVSPCMSAKLCPTLCNLINCSLPASSVHGILQARILKWVALPSSRGSSQPRDQTHVFYISCICRQVLYHWCHLGSTECPAFVKIPEKTWASFQRNLTWQGYTWKHWNLFDFERAPLIQVFFFLIKY